MSLSEIYFSDSEGVRGSRAWESKHWLRSCPISSYWKPAYRLTGLSVVFYPVIYAVGIVGYAIALAVRVVGFALDFLMALGAVICYAFSQKDSWGNYLDDRLVIFGASCFSMVSAAIGMVAPPLAYYVDETMHCVDTVDHFSLSACFSRCVDCVFKIKKANGGWVIVGEKRQPRTSAQQPGASVTRPQNGAIPVVLTALPPSNTSQQSSSQSATRIAPSHHASQQISGQSAAAPLRNASQQTSQSAAVPPSNAAQQISGQNAVAVRRNASQQTSQSAAAPPSNAPQQSSSQSAAALPSNAAQQSSSQSATRIAPSQHASQQIPGQSAAAVPRNASQQISGQSATRIAPPQNAPQQISGMGSLFTRAFGALHSNNLNGPPVTVNLSGPEMLALGDVLQRASTTYSPFESPPNTAHNPDEERKGVPQ